MALLRRKTGSHDEPKAEKKRSASVDEHKVEKKRSKTEDKSGGSDRWKEKYLKIKARHVALKAKYEALEDESHQMLVAMTRQKPVATMSAQLAIVRELVNNLAEALGEDDAAINQVRQLLVKQRVRMRELAHEQGEQNHGEAGEAQPVPAPQGEAGGRSGGQEQGQQGQEDRQDLVQGQRDDQGQDG